MRLVPRYVLAHFRRIFLLSLGAFIGLFLIIDFLDKIDDFTRHGAGAGLFLEYFFYTAPFVATQIVPLAVLLATFLTLGGLSRTNEINAMRSGGISLGRIVLPLLLAALAISAATFLLNETFIPDAALKSRRILEVEVKGRKAISTQQGNIWFQDRGRMVILRAYHAHDQTITGVLVMGFDPNKRLTERIDAHAGRFRDGHWVLEGATVRRFAPDGSTVVDLQHPRDYPLDLEKTPEDFDLQQPRPEEMSYSQLNSLVKRLQREGYDTTRYRVDRASRLANPFASLVMALVGIPFAIQRSRGQSMAKGVGLSIAIGFVFYLVQTLFQAFGYSGALPASFAAGGALLVFLLLGLWALFATRS